MHSPFSAPVLPAELYRVIAENLTEQRDRSTLCTLALVNSVWRTEAQRVLFSSLCERWEARKGSRELYSKVMDRHINFLRTILEHPERLGAYVHAYGHLGLAIDELYMDYGIRLPCHDVPRAQTLWGLTMRTLPHMVNLRHLFFAPQGTGSPEDDAALVRCQFKHLRSFTWGAYGASTPYFVDFLARTPSLRHLNVEFALGAMQEDVCPELESFAIMGMDREKVVACLRSMATRRIKALQITELLKDGLGGGKAAFAQVFPHLRYLKVQRLTRLEEGYGDVRVLQWDSWEMKDLPTLATLPHLHTLALIARPAAYIPPIVDPVTGSIIPNPAPPPIDPLNLKLPVNSATRMEAINTARKHCRELRRVMWVPRVTGEPWVVWEFGEMEKGKEGEGDGDGELREEDVTRRDLTFDTYDRVDRLWWEPYEAMDGDD